jgi:hypothetical protein
LHDRDDQGRMGTTAIVLVGSLIISMALNVFGDFFVGLIHRLEMELYDAKEPVGLWVSPAAGKKMMGMMMMMMMMRRRRRRRVTMWMSACFLADQGRHAPFSMQARIRGFVWSIRDMLYTLLVLGLWAMFGVWYTVHYYGFSLRKGIYFAITSMSTGGLQVRHIHTNQPKAEDRTLKESCTTQREG